MGDVHPRRVEIHTIYTDTNVKQLNRWYRGPCALSQAVSYVSAVSVTAGRPRGASSYTPVPAN